MDIFDSELEIIKCFQETEIKDTLLLPVNDEDAEQAYLSIIQKWEKWTNSSGKSDPPPDFFSDELGLMMDIMRVDDHGHVGRDGKSIVNPTLQRESEVMRELKQKGILDIFPNAQPHLIVDTKLPTDEDHNYIFYRDNFNRTVGSHIKKIANYRSNHPGLKTVFMVFDESSPYFESMEPYKARKIGDVQRGKPHLWFLDSAFMAIVKNSDIDYLVWFTPYKHCDLFSSIDGRVELPIAVVINVRNIETPFIQYETLKMISAEL